MKAVSSLCIVTLTILLGAIDVQASFTVTPMRIEFQIEQGQSGTSSLLIRNVSEKPLSVKLYLKDFVFRPDGSEAELDPGSVSRSCSDWLAISPSVMELEPDEHKNARVSLTIPEDAAGTYWVMLYVEQSSKPTPREAQGGGYSFEINVYPRWAIRIFESVPGTEEKEGQISDLTVTRESEEQPLTAFVEFENTCNSELRCKGWIEIRDESGETVEKIEFEDFSVYPESKRINKAEIPKSLKPGEYSVLAVVDYGGEFLVAGDAFFEITK